MHSILTMMAAINTIQWYKSSLSLRQRATYLTYINCFQHFKLSPPNKHITNAFIPWMNPGIHFSYTYIYNNMRGSTKTDISNENDYLQLLILIPSMFYSPWQFNRLKTELIARLFIRRRSTTLIFVCFKIILGFKVCAYFVVKMLITSLE